MAESNEKLIRELIGGGYLKSKNLIDAFRKIDRKDFVPRELWIEAYGNYPLPIGFGQTISQPLTVAFMLELLAPKAGEKILDIGAGSGWTSALLAEVVGAEGKVVAVERIPELKKMTEENIQKYGFVKEGRVEVFLGDGSNPSMLLRAGWEFGKIIAAAAAEEIPEVWKKQLKVGGRIVAPVGSSIWALDKVSEEEFRTKEYFGFSFVPLIRD